MRIAAFNGVSRIAARVRIAVGSRRDLPVLKNRSVSAPTKDRIIDTKINNLFRPVNFPTLSARAPCEVRTGGGMNNALGTEKFGVGPSVVVLTQPGHWTIGMLFNQIWPFKGTRVPVRALFENLDTRSPSRESASEGVFRRPRRTGGRRRRTSRPAAG